MKKQLDKVIQANKDIRMGDLKLLEREKKFRRQLILLLQMIVDEDNVTISDDVNE